MCEREREREKERIKDRQKQILLNCKLVGILGMEFETPLLFSQELRVLQRRSFIKNPSKVGTGVTKEDTLALISSLAQSHPVQFSCSVVSDFLRPHESQ